MLFLSVMTPTEATETRKRTRQRSPSYPAFGLETVLERARTLYQKEGRNAAPSAAIMQHWKYSPKSSAGLQTLAALKKYGLLEKQSKDQLKLSDLALTILLDEREDSAERAEAITRAALLPSIHREMWDKYGRELPSNANLKHFLCLQKGFTESAADGLIKQFRTTFAFARLEAPDSLLANGRDSNGDDAGESVSTLNVEQERESCSGDAGRGQRAEGRLPLGQRSIPIPLSADEWVTLQGEFPLTEFSWAQLLRVLEAMKPGLVAAPPSELEAAGSE